MTEHLENEEIEPGKQKSDKLVFTWKANTTLKQGLRAAISMSALELWA